MEAPKRKSREMAGVSLECELKEYERWVKDEGGNFSALVNGLLKRSPGFKEYQKLKKEKNENHNS